MQAFNILVGTAKQKPPLSAHSTAREDAIEKSFSGTGQLVWKVGVRLGGSG